MSDPLDRPPAAAVPDGDVEPGPAPGDPDAAAAPADPHAAAGAGEPSPTARRGVRPLQLAIATVTLLAGAALFLSGFSLGARTATTPGTPASDAELFAPFWDTWESITKSYVGEVDREKLVQGAIDGLIGALDDPFSSYMSPEELQRQREAIGGEFSGVGAEVTTRSTTDDGEGCDTIGPTCRLVVVAPMDGSPAERAGLEAGDIIGAVDGQSVDGETLDEAIDRIRGPKGSTVVLTIERGSGEPFELSIVRDTIVQRQVETRELADGAVEYVRIAGISDNAAAQLEEALRAARERGVTRFVLDLRDNPGGFVTGARTIASQFIAEGPVFWEEAADGTQVATSAAPGGLATGDDVRVAVLVNGGTASASEMIAGALQDTGRGTLIGEQTFGKGTIQQWIDLTADSGGFRLSIAKWLTPDKRWIHQEGLVPDIAIPADGAAAGEPGPTGDPYVDAALDLLAEPAAAMPGADMALDAAA
jgi:carboxyl-terminal processing protease